MRLVKHPHIKNCTVKVLTSLPEDALYLRRNNPIKINAALAEELLHLYPSLKIYQHRVCHV